MYYADKREKYEGAMIDIARRAGQTGENSSQIAMGIIDQNRESVENFVRQNGETPKESIEALTAQAAIIHERNVEAKQESGVPDYIVAENAVLQDYALDEFNGDVDNFSPELLGSIFSGAKQAVQKINGKRAESGKPPILTGKKKGALWIKNQAAEKAALTVKTPLIRKPDGNLEKIFTDGDGVNVDGTPIIQQPAGNNKAANTIRDLQNIINGGIGGARQHETKNAIMQYLPYLLIGAVAIYLIAKKS